MRRAAKLKYRELASFDFQQGFSLLELVVVIVVIAVLALLALPDQSYRIAQVKVKESIELVEPFKANIESVYKLTGTFPKNNEEATLPAADKIIGNFITKVEVEDGSMHLFFGNKLSSLAGKILTISPAFVPDSPDSPISWLCGYSEAVSGMESTSNNKTTIPKTHLPIRCR